MGQFKVLNKIGGPKLTFFFHIFSYQLKAGSTNYFQRDLRETYILKRNHNLKYFIGQKYNIHKR